jgi:hypothetical protein
LRVGTIADLSSRQRPGPILLRGAIRQGWVPACAGMTVGGGGDPSFLPPGIKGEARRAMPDRPPRAGIPGRHQQNIGGRG